jgi:hypothetical protein
VPSFLLHYKNYRDLSKDTYLEAGLTGLTGRNDTWKVLGSGGEMVDRTRHLWTFALGADLTVLWEPTGRMRYRNWVWRSEVYLLQKSLLAPDGSGRSDIRTWGFYSYYQAKISRTTELGLRLDFFKPDSKPYASATDVELAPLAVAESGAHQWLTAAYLTWYQSPWVHWRVEWDHAVNHRLGADDDTVWLQAIFAAGPHKHERY